MPRSRCLLQQTEVSAGKWRERSLSWEGDWCRTSCLQKWKWLVEWRPVDKRPRSPCIQRKREGAGWGPSTWGWDGIGWGSVWERLRGTDSLGPSSLYPSGPSWLEITVKGPDFLKVSKASAGSTWTTLWKKERTKNKLGENVCQNFIMTTMTTFTVNDL